MINCSSVQFYLVNVLVSAYNNLWAIVNFLLIFSSTNLIQKQLLINVKHQMTFMYFQNSCFWPNFFILEFTLIMALILSLIMALILCGI